MFSVICLVFLCCLQSVVSEVDDYCIMRSTGQKGVCISIDDCQGAKLDLSFNKIIPQNCSGFVGVYPIVCCKMSDVINTSSNPQKEISNNQITNNKKTTQFTKKTTTTTSRPYLLQEITNFHVEKSTTTSRPYLLEEITNNFNEKKTTNFPFITAPPYKFETQKPVVQEAFNSQGFFQSSSQQKPSGNNQGFFQQPSTTTETVNFLPLSNNGRPSVQNLAASSFNNNSQLGMFQQIVDGNNPVSESQILGESNEENFFMDQSSLAQVSIRKCKEYSQYVFSKFSYPILLINRTVQIVDECFSKYDEEIPSGKAFKKEFPHLALIGYTRYKHTNIWKCSGSLISEKYVITSGNCLNDPQHGDAKFVRLGSITDTDTEPVQDYTIIKKIPHPKFVIGSHYNDVALLLLDRPVKFTAFVRPICLPTEEVGLGRKLIVSGWTSAINSIADKGVDFAIRANLDLVPGPVCEDIFVNKNSILSHGIERMQVCGDRRPYPYNCQITAGSTLLANATREYCMFSLAGVLSYGHMCSNTPVIFTKFTMEIITWIENIVWK